MAYESALEREKDELAEVRAKLAADDDEAAAAEEAETPSGVPAAAESPVEPAAGGAHALSCIFCKKTKVSKSRSTSRIFEYDK